MGVRGPDARDLSSPMVFDNELSLSAFCPRYVIHRSLILPAVRQNTNSTTLFVAGNRIVEIEENLHESQRGRLGEES